MASQRSGKKSNNFATIKRLAGLPVDLKLITPKSTITLDDYKKKYPNLGLPSEECIVLKNYEWVAHSATRNLYVSMGKDTLMFYDPGNHQVFTSDLVDGDWIPNHGVELKPREDILKEEKGENEMKEKKEILDEALNEGAQGGDIPVDPEIESMLNGFNPNELDIKNEEQGLKHSDNFTEEKKPLTEEEKKARDAKREQNKAEREAHQQELVDTISKSAEGVEYSNTAAIAAFNRANGGCILGFITAKDELLKMVPTTQTVTDTATGAVKTVQGATSEEQKAAAENKAVNKALTRKEVVIKPKHQMPGKVLGAVVKMPEGGIIDYQDYLAGKKLTPDASKMDLKIILGDKDKMTTLINTCFRNSIPTSPETFGFSTNILLYARPRKDKKGETKFIKGFKTENKKPYIQPNAYLPLEVYKTIDQTKDLTPAEAHDLSESQFIGLTLSTKAKPTPTIQKLDAKSRQKINIDENGNITSVWFTTDASKKESISVKPYYTTNKEETLTTLPFAIKAKHEPKTAGKNATWRWVTYGINDSSEDSKKNNSLALARSGGKFSKFYNACGGDKILNETTLMALKPTRRKSSGANEIPEAALNKLIASELSGRPDLTNVGLDAEALTTDLLAMLGMQAKAPNQEGK